MSTSVTETSADSYSLHVGVACSGSCASGGDNTSDQGSTITLPIPAFNGPCNVNNMVGDTAASTIGPLYEEATSASTTTGISEITDINKETTTQNNEVGIKTRTKNSLVARLGKRLPVPNTLLLLPSTSSSSSATASASGGCHCGDITSKSQTASPVTHQGFDLTKNLSVAGQKLFNRPKSTSNLNDRKKCQKKKQQQQQKQQSLQSEKNTKSNEKLSETADDSATIDGGNVSKNGSQTNANAVAEDTPSGSTNRNTTTTTTTKNSKTNFSNIITSLLRTTTL